MWQVDGEKDCALTWGGLTDTADAMEKKLAVVVETRFIVRSQPRS